MRRQKIIKCYLARLRGQFEYNSKNDKAKDHNKTDQQANLIIK